MPTSLFQYEMLPTTWFFVSTLILLAVFFKFNRFWSVRNLDLIGLILLTPGLTAVAMNDHRGYAWLFAVGFLMALRMLFDTVMVRRPLLEPNLTPGGLTFSCFFLLLFVFAALLINRGDQPDTIRTVRLEQILTTRHLRQGIGMNPTTLMFSADELANVPPGFLPFHALSETTNLLVLPSVHIREEILQASGLLPTPSDSAPDAVRSEMPPTPQQLSSDSPIAEKPVVQGLQPIRLPSLGILVLCLGAAIFGHLAIVFAFVHIGHCHFGNIRTGIACATLYLLHPYVNQMVARLDHLIPAALLLWAVAMYRRPLLSGFWIGTAAALVFYPIFLLPLWCSFYWKRGWIRFLGGTGAALGLFVVLLLFSPLTLGSYGNQLLHLAGKSSLLILTQPNGFWTANDFINRVPVMTLFFVSCFGMVIWPSHKHLATLLGCSAFLLLTVQYWQIHQGGLFMAWYLPLVILTIFRPNLEDRVAHATVVV